MNVEIKKLLDDSAKAELLEKIADVLDTDGHRLVVITGTPGTENSSMAVTVYQSGFQYLFEELGFIREGHDIEEDRSEDEDE